MTIADLRALDHRVVSVVMADQVMLPAKTFGFNALGINVDNVDLIFQA
mgnify:CR=1 FL=1